MNKLKWFMTFLSVAFVWSLPLLASIGFAEINSTSISQYISNAHATGAMAVTSYIPLVIIQNYQKFFVNYVTESWFLKFSQVAFFIFYGSFLICTVTLNKYLHTIVVALFCISFIIHSIVLLAKVVNSRLSQIVLGIGILSFASLLFAEGNWFWFFECIGYTSMVFFTPIEIEYSKQKNIRHYEEKHTFIEASRFDIV